MVEHDFRFNLLNPQHTLTECRALVPGRYQVTGNGGSIRSRRRADRDPQRRQGLVHAPDRRNGSPPDQPAWPMGRGGQWSGVRRIGDPHLASEL